MIVSKNRICDLVNEASCFGFSGVELDVVRRWYFDAAVEYRSRHAEPSSIEGRLEYASSVKEYCAAVTRSLIAKRVDDLHRGVD